MNYRVQRKNLELFRKLQSKGYTTSLIFKDDKIEYVTLEIDGRKILLSYHKYKNFDMRCDVGELYKDNLVWCTYGFKNLPNDIVSEYISSLSINKDEYYISSLDEYKRIFQAYLSENRYVEKNDYNLNGFLT